MAASGVVQDIDSDYRPGMPELQIFPDRDKLAAVNVPVGRLADTISLYVGGQRVGKFTDRGRRYDVRVRLMLQQRDSPNDLTPIALRSGDNRLVPLADVVTFRTVSTLPVVNRYNHQRSIQITANPAPGVSQGEAIARCQQIADEARRQLDAERRQAGQPATNFNVIELGNAQAMRETINSLVFALVLGVVIAYMILGVQFNSFIHPFTVLLAMPFAVTGALATLWLTGDTLNMIHQPATGGRHGGARGGAGGVPGAAAAHPDDVGGHRGRGRARGAGPGSRCRDARADGTGHHRWHRVVYPGDARARAGVLRADRAPPRRLR
jgi:multidrug efflux pump subunit AcrB